MLEVTAPTGNDLPEGLVAVGIPCFVGEAGPTLAVGSDLVPGVDVPASLDADWCSRQGFGAKPGQTVVLRSLEAGKPDVVLVGVGSSAGLAGNRGVELLRRASASFVRAAGHGAAALLVLPAVTGIGAGDAAAAAAEAGALATYRFDECRSADPSPSLAALVLRPASSEDAEAVAEGVLRGAQVAESVAFARDLVNRPPSNLTPDVFAATVVERFAGVADVTVEVWDEERIVAERLGGLLGVAAGSEQPPRLVRVEYRPANPYVFDGRTPHLALVGKGITFDSGGLSLKPAGGMETMKTDMGGAAAVLAAIDAAASLGLRIPIVGWTPMTENMPSGTATKPGDVLTTRAGKTIEVLNTDAEGRLILADGLTLAVESEPDAIIDLATLTGAAIVALGKDIAGLLANDDELRVLVGEAGDEAGEPSWPLPLPEDYKDHIESEIADMKNIGKAGQAGTISAALLLAEFVGSVPWAHLDIAGPSRTDDNRWYRSKGGSGFGTRTLVALAGSEEFGRWLATRPTA